MTDLSRFDNHTPGPWEWQLTVLFGDVCNGSNDGDHPYLAETNYGNNIDMRLIAAAPALLARVKELEEALDGIRIMGSTGKAVYDIEDVEHFVKVLNKEWLDV